jgi:hypothetical protein
MESPYGYQPVRVELFKQRIGQKQAAKDIGVSWGHFRKVIIGHCHPMQAVREKLPVYLGVPLEELFTPEVLAKPYAAGRGVKR